LAGLYGDRLYNPLPCCDTFICIFLGGKPDKRRKTAGPEKGTYCGGHGVNLLANINSKNTDKNGKSFELGSNESLDHTFERVTLQTYIDQVNTYEQILNPLSVILERGLGAGGPDYLGAEDLGWGPEGAQLGPALAGIGVSKMPQLENDAGNYGNKSRNRYIFIYAYVYIYMYVYVYLCIYLYMSMYLCVYAYAHMYTFVFIYIVYR
jgi:hypothetical protein